MFSLGYFLKRRVAQCYKLLCQLHLQKCKSMFAWDDLRLALAIARGGNLATAAATLGVNHSTVFRRLNALESRLGSKLFERLASGYRATENGARLIEAAERMETEAFALDRELTGRDTRLSGQLRVTCSETVGLRILTGEIARFRATHPGIGVELSVDNRMLDLSRREADVALRVMRPAQGELFGRKLSDLQWAIYASEDYLRERRAPRNLGDLERHCMIGWVEAGPQIKAQMWLSRHVPCAAVGFRTNTLVNQWTAAREGLGIAILPMYLAAGTAGLIRLLDPLENLVTELWIITHRSLKDTARVRSFMEFVSDGVKCRIATLEGADDGHVDGTAC